ncbi:MAG: hypothetical protein IT536_20430 [Hyphomicrobiales bacterium]|nr:hypothetical protein [Hyphomicrobiales bacterium]
MATRETARSAAQCVLPGERDQSSERGAGNGVLFKVVLKARMTDRRIMSVLRQNRVFSGAMQSGGRRLVFGSLGLLAVALAGCASSLPVRNFAADYQRASSQSVRVVGYAPFRVAELRSERRLKVELNSLAQAFAGLVDPLVMLGVSDGIPPLSAHQAAAQAFLAETGRPSCTVTASAVLPNGRAFEFQYACPAQPSGQS